MNIGERIKRRREELGLSVDDVAKMLGKHRATVYRYESDEIEKFPTNVLEPLATVLQTTPSVLMGWEETPVLPHGAIPLPHTSKVPLIGNIACGVPILAEQNIDELVDLPEHIKANFALRCKGDSMINAGIHDGDIVYIREQPDVANGKIAAVMVGDEEATLKRFRKDGDVIFLMPENPEYEVKTYVGEQIRQLRVLGLAVGYTHAIK